MDLKTEQLLVCRQYGSLFVPPQPLDKLGIANDFFLGISPINGLRHRPSHGTCGWYLWAGSDLSNEDDYFKPFHVMHLEEYNPSVRRFLGLGPGWRFLVAEDYEDVWYDESVDVE